MDNGRSAGTGAACGKPARAAEFGRPVSGWFCCAAFGASWAVSRRSGQSAATVAADGGDTAQRELRTWDFRGGRLNLGRDEPPAAAAACGARLRRFFCRRRWPGRPRERARPSRPAVRPRAAGALVWLAVPRRSARVFAERAGRRGRCTRGAIAAFCRRRRWPGRPRQRARPSRPAVRPRAAGALVWLAVPRRSARVFAERAGRRGRCTHGAIAVFSRRRRWRGRPRERARPSRPAVGPRAAGACSWLAVPRRSARVFVERAGRRGRGTRGAIAAFSCRRRWPGRPRQRARPSRPAVGPRAAGACSWLAVPRRSARVFAERAGRRGRGTRGAIAAFCRRRRWPGRPRQRARPSRPAVGPRAAGACSWLAVPRRAARVFAERAGRRGRCTHGAIAVFSRRRRWPGRPRQRARSSRPAVGPRVAGACSWSAVPRRAARVFVERAGRRGRCTRGALAARVFAPARFSYTSRKGEGTTME
ncbi:hypothetical protein B7759_05984 (plasmid) [Burkholderia glumae]|nr:hypothetical protein B7759_05984 [Burkholderia glumae]